MLYYLLFVQMLWMFFLKLRLEHRPSVQSSLSRAVAKAMAQLRPPLDTVLRKAAVLQVKHARLDFDKKNNVPGSTPLLVSGKVLEQ